TGRRRMLARVRVVRAGAARSYLATAGKQVKARAGRVLGDLGRQFAIKQRRRVTEPGGDGGEHPVPFVIGELPDPDPDLIRLGLPSPYPGPCLARRQCQVADRSGARVVPAAGQPVGVQPRPLLQCLQPGPPPPGAAEFGLLNACPGHIVAHVAARRLTSSVSSASDSSAIQRSPEPITASARSRLVSSRAAMRSSSVPSAMSRCTCTGRSWPIRYARSVA